MPESGAPPFARVAVVALHALSILLVTAAAAVLPDGLPGAGDAQRPAAAVGGDESTGTPRVTVSLNRGWRFKQAAGLSGVEQTQFDDSDWEQVSTPHTWNRLGNAGTERSPQSNDTQGAGWYRLRFAAPAAAAGSSHSRYFLQFDAVGTIADIWLNGHYLGKHAGAFARFRFEATAAIRPSAQNLLVVRADNSRPRPGATTENVIPLSGDFFMFGGIYRRVALIVTHPVHLDLLDFGGPGVYGRAVSIESGSAIVEVTSRVVNEQMTPQRVSVVSEIADADGNVVASDTSAAGPVAPGAVLVLHRNLPVANPRLWQGVHDPYLYRVSVTLKSNTGRVLDRLSQPLGLRTVRFDPDRGFLLNGRHEALHGVALHQDRAGKGWAVSDADQDEDFAILCDLGANAVRLAHYQHDQRSYELADERGIIVWAEIPLVNEVSFDGSPASAALSANARQQLLELIQQNRNHPSVALWSIANEIDLTATEHPGSSRPGSLLGSLAGLARAYDADRATTLADCCEPEVAPHGGQAPTDRDAVVGITDTVGYNRYFGWYYGHLADFGPMLDQAHARHPQLPLSVSEYGAGGALTQHSDDALGGPIKPKGRPHPEEYQNLFHEKSWEALRQRPYLWGSFIWNLCDFVSDSRREGDLTDLNEKGLVSWDRKVRKDAFYFYRANWSTQPTLHLVGRRYADRPYSVLDVKAYSNASRASLTLNGADQGSSGCSNGICIWHEVHLRPGSNDLRVSADIAGSLATDSVQWNYSGEPAHLRIKAGDLSGHVTPDGQRYGSDMYFSGGEGRAVNSPYTPPDERVEVAGTSDPTLYDSFREGRFAYHIPVPEGRYRVTLEFEEPVAAAGDRLFDVRINGEPVLKRFDIFSAAGGRLKALHRTFKARARDGAIRIELEPVKGSALLAAIAIEPAS